MAFRSFPDLPGPLCNLQDEINRLFTGIYHGGLSTRPFDGQEWSPAVDLYEQSDRYSLHVEIPGVNAAEVDISCVGARLTIRGKKPKPIELDEDDTTIRGERRFGAFCRVIDLPGDIDADRISAESKDGVLEITISKPESSKPKSVRVEVKGG